MIAFSCTRILYRARKKNKRQLRATLDGSHSMAHIKGRESTRFIVIFTSSNFYSDRN